MRKLVKILAVAIAVLFVMPLTGCKTKEDFSFWAYAPANAAKKAAFEQMIARFTEETGIEVQLNLVTKDQYNRSLNSALGSKSKPAVFYLDQPLVADYAYTLEDMTSYYSTIGLAKDDFFSGSYDTVMIDGKPMGIPLTITTSVLFYNPSLVSNLPTDWESWLALNPGAGKALFGGIGTGGYLSWYFQAFLENAGGSFMNEANTEITFNDANGVAAAEFLKNLYGKSAKAIRDEANAFTSGKIAFMLGSSSEIDNFNTSSPTFNYNATKLIPKNQGDTAYSNIGGENIVVHKDSSKKEEAKKLLEFLYREDNIRFLANLTGNFAAVEGYATVDSTDPQKAKKEVVLEQLATAAARPRIAGWLDVNDNYLAAALGNILNDANGKDIIQAQLNTAAEQSKTALKI